MKQACAMEFILPVFSFRGTRNSGGSQGDLCKHLCLVA